MANRERDGIRINYHRRTRGAFVLPVSSLPKDLREFDDNGIVIRPVAGGSEESLLEGKEPFILQQRPANKKARDD